MKKNILIPFFIIFCFSVFSQHFSNRELFFVTENFSLLLFPTNDEILLLFRKNGSPLKNSKVCFYKNGHITKPQTTAKDGTLRIKRPDEPFIQFRFGSYRTIHTFVLPEYKHTVKHKISVERNKDSLLMNGEIAHSAQKVRLVYRDGQNAVDVQETALNNGKFQQQLLPNNKLFFIDIYAEEDFVCTTLVNFGKQSVDFAYPEKIKTFIPKKLEITPEMQLDCKKINSIESLLLSFSRCGENAEKLYFADNGKMFGLQPAMNDGILSGTAEVIMKNGESVKENFCVPVLPSAFENGKFRSYETTDKEFFFFSQEERKEAFLIFYKEYVRYACAVSVTKGINRIQLPADLQKTSCVSATILCTDENSGSNTGLFCRFVNTGNENFYDIAGLNKSTVFLTQPKNAAENNLNFYCKVGSVTDDNSAVYAEISIKNLKSEQRSIKLQSVFSEEAVREDLLSQQIVLEPKEELQIRFDLPLEHDKKSSRNILVTEVTSAGEEAVFWMPQQRVETISPYYESFTVSGRLIENRTSEIPIVLPNNEMPLELSCFLSTDTAAVSMAKGILTENCADYVFEEALLDYLQKRRQPNENYDNFGFVYPYFLNNFFDEQNMIRRFSFDKNYDIDSSLLYLYVASKIPDLAMPKKIAAVTSFFRSNPELLAGKSLRQKLFYYSVKENQKITENGTDYLYAGQPVERWLFDGKQSNQPESTIGKIIQLLPDAENNKNSEVEFSLSQSFTPATESSGSLVKGQSAVNKITLPENYVSMTGKREIRYKIAKNGADDLFYLINGRFYSNQINVGSNTLRISVMDRDDMPLYSGSRLMKNTKYSAKVYLPDELKDRTCVLLMKDRLVSAVRHITLSDGSVWDTARPIFFTDSDLTFSFLADISFYFDDICFVVIPLVAGEAWAYYANYSE